MSDAPEELWADWDYEAIDGVCGVHTQKRFASGYEPECPPIRYVRADRIEELEAKLAEAVRHMSDEELLHREYEKLLRERIEELEADLRKMSLDYLAASRQAQENFQMYVDANEARIDAETKLGKAIEALEKVQAFVRDLEPYADQGHTLVPALRDACATLAELNYDERSERKGETNG